MTYEVGTTIDLRWMNKSTPQELPAQKQMVAEKTNGLVEVGTTFMLKMVNGQLIASRKIPVAFA